MKPHLHAELIKAWADGALIESFSKVHEKWIPCHKPGWLETHEYRIKPEEKQPVARWLWVDENNRIMSVMQSEEEVRHGLTKLEWSRTEFPA